MPPKRKKKQPTQKQRQSQRQSVVVNIGKASTTKRRRNAGRGGLPPPSHLQNLFPPTIIQQQAPNIAVLENQISRLTSLIQEKPHIPVLNTPLSVDTRTAVAQKMAGEQAEARRPGPTAENFQVPPSRAREQPIEASVPIIRFKQPPVSTAGSSTIPDVMEMPDLSVSSFGELPPASEYYTQQLVSDKPPPNRAEDDSVGVEETREEKKRRKQAARSLKQAREKAEVKAKLDRGEELNEREKKVAGSKSLQPGIKRAEELGLFVP